jgi:GT2 family glycosyltransferase
MAESMRIAVLLTCHDRKDKTLACLSALARQRPVDGVELETILVDDGSSDGTGSAAREIDPDIRVIEGDGTLYWCGGMRRAFAAAMETGYDAYLWLNDDVVLREFALGALLDTLAEVGGDTGRSAIVVGALEEPERGRTSYGGFAIDSRLRRWVFAAVPPGSSPVPCDTFNGNCVLIPDRVARRVGNLSSEFTHRLGDLDYGLRARGMGIPSWLAPGHMGACPRNATEGSWTDPRVPLAERRRLRSQTTGFPTREWMFFVRRHGGPLWPLAWPAMQVRTLFPRLWVRVRSLAHRVPRRSD